MNDAKHESGPSELVRRYVARKLGILQDRYLRGLPGAARQLAQLRRAGGKAPGATPETWAIELEELPRVLVGHGPNPSPGEWAVHIAFTLYAFHQQSQGERMYIPGWENGFGKAVRKLLSIQGERSGLEDGQMPRRLSAMVTAQSVEELSHYARQLVGLLRANAIPVDYGLFGKQVYLFQFPSTRNSVCLQWAREYADYTDAEKKSGNRESMTPEDKDE